MSETHRKTWHGPQYYFGLHYDLHANEKDTDLGERADPRHLVPTLRLMGADFVQTDCKGHPGYTSWYSKTPDASISPGVKKDALKGWRAATKRLGQPLHCHYSGIWDKAAATKHPEWAVVRKPGAPATPPCEKMCPRSPYLEKLMIPQMIELIDDWQVDGFWIDGDLWAVEPCYCGQCRKAFTQKTGIATPPTETSDLNWPAWINFTREGFEEYVTRYCDAVHAHKPGVLVCSNWLQTFKHPGEPKVPTDWISGDNSWVWGLDGSRCEARFISTRGKHWDIMLWGFYKTQGMSDQTAPWTFKPVQMLQQEASVTLALGGALQLYEHPQWLRNGQLVPWRMKRLGEVGRFVKARKTLCQDTETIPQIAVLHSEHHARRHTGMNLHGGVDASPVQGAVFSLLENHHGVDIMDEWALLPRLAEFSLVVAPEQDDMSEVMVEALKKYVRAGGGLIVSGSAAFERFGGEFLGVASAKVEEKATYHVPAADGAVAIYSNTWRLVKPREARAMGKLGKTSLLGERLIPHPAATIRKIGKGKVAYLPFDAFRFFDRCRYPLLRIFVGDVVRALNPRFTIRVAAPTCVDVILRRKGSRTIIHLINRASGIPNRPNDGTIDEIPLVGPVKVEVEAPKRPRKVELAFEKQPMQWKYVSGKIVVMIHNVHIHAALAIECS